MRGLSRAKSLRGMVKSRQKRNKERRKKYTPRAVLRDSPFKEYPTDGIYDFGLSDPISGYDSDEKFVHNKQALILRPKQKHAEMILPVTWSACFDEKKDSIDALSFELEIWEPNPNLTDLLVEKFGSPVNFNLNIDMSKSIKTGLFKNKYGSQNIHLYIDQLYRKNPLDRRASFYGHTSEKNTKKAAEEAEPAVQGVLNKLCPQHPWRGIGEVNVEMDMGPLSDWDEKSKLLNLNIDYLMEYACEFSQITGMDIEGYGVQLALLISSSVHDFNSIDGAVKSSIRIWEMKWKTNWEGKDKQVLRVDIQYGKPGMTTEEIESVHTAISEMVGVSFLKLYWDSSDTSIIRRTNSSYFQKEYDKRYGFGVRLRRLENNQFKVI